MSKSKYTYGDATKAFLEFAATHVMPTESSDLGYRMAWYTMAQQAASEQYQHTRSWLLNHKLEVPWR